MGERGKIRMLLNVEYLTELIKGKSWSERQLASKSGLSSAAISRIITGRRGAGTRDLTGIIRAFSDEPIERLFILPR
jgi:transcriptional regulator with XRE-family HTH domain